MKNIVDFTSKIKEKFTMRKDIAPVEESSTASRAYSAGDKFYYGNLLQKAITDIAQGAAFVGGTNFENADPVTTTIQNLSNQTNALELYTKGKNKLVTNSASKTESGVSYVNIGDGTVICSGTQTGANAYHFLSPSVSDISVLPRIKAGGSYILTGGKSANKAVGINLYNGSNLLNQYIDDGSGVTFTIPSNCNKVAIYLYQPTSGTAQNETYQVMLRDSDISDSTWEPIYNTIKQLTKETTGLIDNQNVNGAVNILPLDLATIKSLNQQWTWSGSSASYKGINITVYDNKIVATGTIAANDYVTLVLVDNAWIESNLKTGQSYKLIGCPSGGSETGYYMQTFRMPSVFDYGDGAEFTFRYTQTGKVIQIAVVGGTSGTTISNVEFRPMLGLASQPDFDYAHGYVPYAKTNRELTEDVADIPYQALTDNGSSEYTLTEGKMWQTKGVTFLYVAVQCNTVSPSSGGTHIKISEIPSKFKKPPLILYPAIAPYRDATTGAGTQLQIATNGQIAIRGGEVGGKYSGLFSY